jgi:hypothetical protein
LKVRCRASSDKGKETQVCPTNLMKIVERNIGEPINGTTDCGLLYGFQTLVGKYNTYKTLNQEDIPTRGFRGSNCSVTSNKTPIIDRIKILYDLIDSNNIVELKDLKIVPFGLSSDKQTKYDYETFDEMTSAQLCIYLELLLRAFEMFHIDGKKWSLTLVDSARAIGPLRGRDGRLTMKHLFTIQEK